MQPQMILEGRHPAEHLITLRTHQVVCGVQGLMETQVFLWDYESLLLTPQKKSEVRNTKNHKSIQINFV